MKCGNFLSSLAAIVLISLAFPTLAPAETNAGVNGTYNVRGTNSNGSTYSGTAEVVAQGTSVRMSWVIANGDKFKGTGKIEGNRLVVDWGQKYPVIYEVGRGGVLNGKWDNGRGSETLTPRR